MRWLFYKPRHAHKHKFEQKGTTMVGWSVLECECREVVLS